MTFCKSFRGAVALAVVLSVVACSGDDKPKPGPITSNPIVPEVAAYPFPSDYYLVEDTSTATGRRVEIPVEALPENVDSIASGFDGYSRLPIIATYLPGGVDPSTLLDLDDHAGSVGDNAPVLLIEENTWKRIPILAETDLTAIDDEERALLIRPLTLLDENTGYVVLVRNQLRDPSGAEFKRSYASESLLEGNPTDDPSIENQRGSFELVLQAIDESGIDKNSVVQGWSFHTRSEESVTSTLLQVQDLAESAEIGEYEITSDEIEELEVGSNRQIVGKFVGPNFIGDDNKISLDENGDVVQNGTREVEFSLTIPSTIDETRPVIIYGHGFFGSWRQATRGSVTDIGHEYRFSAAGTYIGFNSQNEAKTLQGVANLDNLPELVADVQQNMANQTVLARLIREKLSVDITVDRGEGAFPAFDASNVHYYGISNGGTFGALAMATSPQFERSVLMVGGGGLIHFLERAVQWREFGPLVGQVYREARERQMVFSLIQMIFDPIDPINYAPHLVKDRYPGRKPMKTMLLMARYDSQVRNLVTEWVARAADLPLITPSPKEVYGLRQKTAAEPDGLDEDGGFFVYDEKVEPSPLGNIPPESDNDTHGTLRYIPAVRTQLGTFFETGKMVQFCDGPCDPE